MTMIDTEHFKKKLEDEKKLLEEELKSIGRINPSNPADWEARPGDMATFEPDKNDAADRIEQYEENTGILKELEIRYNNVLLALKKMGEGTYGICEIGKKEIEIARLEANPAARTCKQHMEEI